MKQIKILRKGCGMSQDELARMLQVDRSTVAKWETRDVFPRGEQVKRLSDIFKCSIDERYGQGGEESQNSA